MAVISSVYLWAFVSEGSRDQGILCVSVCVWSKDQDRKKARKRMRNWRWMDGFTVVVQALLYLTDLVKSQRSS